MRASSGFLLLIVAYLHFCRAECPPEAGQPLDLNQFSGKWFLIAGTPVTGRSLSSCGEFQVTKASTNEFKIVYSAISHRGNRPVTFHVNGKVNGTTMNDAVANWKLVGSTNVLGPFKHIVVSKDYSSYLAMVVCSEKDSSHVPGYKFSMIWSREKTLSHMILEELKTALAPYVNKINILLANQENC